MPKKKKGAAAKRPPPIPAVGEVNITGSEVQHAADVDTGAVGDVPAAVEDQATPSHETDAAEELGVTPAVDEHQRFVAEHTQLKAALAQQSVECDTADDHGDAGLETGVPSAFSGGEQAALADLPDAELSRTPIRGVLNHASLGRDHSSLRGEVYALDDQVTAVLQKGTTTNCLTPHKLDGINPEAVATAQKNPAAPPKTGTLADKIREELDQLQMRICSVANKFAPTGTALEMTSLEEMKRDLEEQNRELEAAVRSIVDASPAMDSSDKFFMKLESVLAIALQSGHMSPSHGGQPGMHRSWPKSANRTVNEGVSRSYSWSNSRSVDRHGISRVALSQTSAASSDCSHEGAAFDQELTLNTLRNDYKTIDAALSKQGESSQGSSTLIQELLSDIIHNRELRSRIELFFRLEVACDEGFQEEARQRLAQISSDIEASQARLAVIRSCHDLLSKVPSTPIPLEECLIVQMPEDDPSIGRPHGDTDNSSAAPAVVLAYGRMQEALARFSFGGQLYLILAVAVCLTAPLAPFALPVIGGLFLAFLGIYQIRYVRVGEREKTRHPSPEAPSESPRLLVPASFVATLLLLAAALSFGYVIFTLMDLRGTPSCSGEFRFSPACEDPSLPLRESYPVMGDVSNSSSDIIRESGASQQNPEPSPSPGDNAPEADTEQQDATSPGSEQGDATGTGGAVPDSTPSPSQPAMPSQPIFTPLGGDFLGYVVVAVATKSDTLSISTDDTDPICSDQPYTFQSAELRLVESNVIRARSCRSTDQSDVLIQTYNIAPGPVVKAVFLFPGGVSASQIDLDDFTRQFSALADVPKWRLLSKKADAERRLLSARILLDILCNSTESANELAQAVRQTNWRSLSAGSRGVAGVDVSVFDPNRETTSAPVHNTNSTPQGFMGSDAANSGRDEAGCVNTLSEEEYLRLVSHCNGANVCADDLPKLSAWLSCDDHLFISAACAGGMVVLALFVAVYSRFACYALERLVGSGSACCACHA